MNKTRKSNTVAASKVTFTELMLPSHSNFSGKIHGGYLLQLMDQIAFASASKYSGSYCVTASVDTVDFLNPVEIGELLTLIASLNFVGTTSMFVGIIVISENIRTGKVKHCNSSYFTMVAKDEFGKPTQVPHLELRSLDEVRRFFDAVRRINHKRNLKTLQENFDYQSTEALEKLKEYNVLVKI